jgi:hypothetical protein
MVSLLRGKPVFALELAGRTSIPFRSLPKGMPSSAARDGRLTGVVSLCATAWDVSPSVSGTKGSLNVSVAVGSCSPLG